MKRSSPTDPVALAERFLVTYRRVHDEVWKGRSISSSDPSVDKAAAPVLEEFKSLPIEAQMQAIGSGACGIGFEAHYARHVRTVDAGNVLACLHALQRGLRRQIRPVDRGDPPWRVYESLSSTFRRVLGKCRSHPSCAEMASAYYRLFRDVPKSRASEFAAASRDPQSEFERQWKEACSSKSWIQSRDGVLARRGLRDGRDLFVDYSALNLYRAVYESLSADPPEAAATVLDLAGQAKGATPSAKWIDGLDTFRSKLPVRSMRRLTCRILDEFPRDYDFPDFDGKIFLGIETAARDLSRGLLWIGGRFLDDALFDRCVEAVRQHSRLGDSSGVYAPPVIRALVLSGHPRVVNALQHLRRDIAHKNIRKALDRAVADLAAGKKLTPGELEDASADTFALDARGQRSWTVKGCRVVLTLRESKGVSLDLFDTRRRKELASPPPGVEDAPEFAEIRDVRAKLTRDLALHRSRLEEAMIVRREWGADSWGPSVARHPVLAHLARRLLWRIVDGACTRTACFRVGRSGPAWVDRSGAAFTPSPAARYSIPHPVELGLTEMRLWQKWLVRERIVQPFKQLFRETYVPTPAERRQGAYSNRFASHIVPHKQMYALLKQRGWTGFGGFGYDGGDEGFRDFPAHGVRAEMVRDAPDGGERGLVTLDRISFSRPPPRPPPIRSLPEWKAGDTWAATDKHQSLARRLTVDLTEVDPIVFSETMRDVDLVASVAGRGTDRFWRDWEKRRASGELVWEDERDRYDELHSVPAACRRRLLEEVLPALGLGRRVRFEGSAVLVKGARGTYRIHLGSGSVHREPEGRYVCIVQDLSQPLPDWAAAEENDAMTLSIFSKVLLLANDDRITDPSILKQLG